MHPLLMLILGILTPFIITALLLAPVYLALFGAVYVIYMANPQAAAALLGRIGDPFYILDVYSQLYHYWSANHGALSFVHYTLPIVALPLAGLLLALYITYKVTKGLLHLFRLGSSENH